MFEAFVEVAEVGPDPQQLKAAARQERQAAKEAVRQQRAAEAEAKQEAKQHARAERSKSREQADRAKAEARAEAAATKAAERVDKELAKQEAPEEAEVVPAAPVSQTNREAARRERAEAKEAARRAKEAKRVDEDDHIVEPPREPKLDRADRRRLAKSERSRAKKESRIAAGEQAAASSSSVPVGKRIGLLLASLLGAVGLICSVVLALGALLVALGATDGNSAYDSISRICDALVGPLRDLFSFTGTNAKMKESLVAWGAGSIGYLLVGIFVQSFLRARFDED